MISMAHDKLSDDHVSYELLPGSARLVINSKEIHTGMGARRFLTEKSGCHQLARPRDYAGLCFLRERETAQWSMVPFL